ncbi:MAG: N-acetylmuramic acid 6-phosphate etherase [Nanoarchaeota archaeon]|nr:N-acetylmuramic acid 6-phosphate etherase [Nanoarchaeota archaeon]
MNITESKSIFNDLEGMSVMEILGGINSMDLEVPKIVKEAISQIEELVNEVVKRMKVGGRLFYIGAGTSGRLGIIDASECPPTFGVEDDLVVGIIAGGDLAIRNAVENSEDDLEQAWKDLKREGVSDKDFVIGIAASGSTPYVVSGMKKARDNGIATGCITCKEGTELALNVDYPVEVVTGIEFIEGSTRMKAGTAQKLVLNMISTTVMIKLGKTRGGKMVDMKISNEKLFLRGLNILKEELGIGTDEASKLLREKGSVRKALNFEEIVYK